ncbi:MAG: LysR family transcriptional regulator [Minwuiales bacterium]|nr:LysR family transcriptional regulator [Minwuiales bacterium]
MLDWTALRDFLAVAEAGSLSAAAKHLRVSQPTVSRRIAALESGLDARLFNRTPRGLELTEAGEMILDHAKRMDQEAVAVERTASGTDSGLEGTVRLSATEGIGVEWLTGELAGFRDAYPGIRIELVIDNAAVNLLRREADIAVRLFRPQQSDLIAKRVGTHAVRLFAAKSYADRYGIPEKVEDLAKHYIVGFDEAFGHITQAKWLLRHVPADRMVFSSNSLLSQLAAVRAGVGIGSASALVGHRDPNLRPVLPHIDVANQEIWLVTHPDLKRSARIRAAFDYLADLIARNGEELAGGGPNRG